MSNLTPQQIVEQLDLYIVGQDKAKRSVANALRNRWRRMQLDAEIRPEVTPKNILMIGPTGVGKTEIARRMAKLTQAPFIKVEATKFTEVGYVGRDVETIIRDLIENAINMLREVEIKKHEQQAEDLAEERILDVLLPVARDTDAENNDSNTRQIFRKKLREGELDDKEISIQLRGPQVGIEIMTPPGMEDMTNQLQSMFAGMQTESKEQRLKVKDALKALKDEEAENLLKEDELKKQAIQAVEQNGIVFIDEIDKVCKADSSSGDISREGVQRDLLPLIEGCSVTTKYGRIKTDHILFIASGAFHLSRPSDLIPELQGRLPIRVELNALKPQDFCRILTEPSFSLAKQYKALLATEGVQIEFTEEGISELAELAFKVNESTENIGARRLHTMLETLLEDVSFNAADLKGKNLEINATFVKQHLADLTQDQDLSHYIL